MRYSLKGELFLHRVRGFGGSARSGSGSVASSVGSARSGSGGIASGGVSRDTGGGGLAGRATTLVEGTIGGGGGGVGRITIRHQGTQPTVASSPAPTYIVY